MVYTPKANQSAKKVKKQTKKTKRVISKKPLKVKGSTKKAGLKKKSSNISLKVNGKKDQTKNDDHHNHIMPAHVIQKKKRGEILNEDEIKYFIHGLAKGTLPEYQMSALSMAICFQGMNFDETMFMTKAMVESGKVMQWKKGGYLVDKHSTGGQGDKTSLILAPLLACQGVRIPMISGRGLGPTGGTLDKLESIKGFRVSLSLDEVQNITNSVGLVIAAQTADIAPADKKLYALRDVTGTVDCLPLIVSSIMSKKLAENVDGLVLDVKFGSGAFMRSKEASLELGQAMVEVGKRYGKKVVALQTNMNQPLGNQIGNALEIQECLDILGGKQRPNDLVDVVMALGAEMLAMAGLANEMEKNLKNGAGLAKFLQMIKAQGGDMSQSLPVANYKKAIKVPKSGYIHSIECDQLGFAVIALGGGRKVASDLIDFAVGFEHPKKIGDKVNAGETLIMMHYNDISKANEAEKMVLSAYSIKDTPVVNKEKLITQRIV